MPSGLSKDPDMVKGMILLFIVLLVVSVIVYSVVNGQNKEKQYNYHERPSMHSSMNEEA